MFGAPAAGMALAAPGAVTGGKFEIPPLFSMDVVDRIEKAMSGDAEELTRALGDRGSVLKGELLDPFFQGFEKRRTIEQRLKDMSRTQQQQMAGVAPVMGGFGLPAAPAPAQGSSGDQVLSLTFAFTDIFVPDTRFQGSVKRVSDACAKDLELIGRGDLKGVPLPCSELDHILSTASFLAQSLKEHPMRCLSLVIAARGSGGAAGDEEDVRREASRIYFEQQIRVLSLICRLLRECAPPPPGEGGGDDDWVRACKVALEGMEAGKPAGGLAKRLCDVMHYCFEDYATCLSRAASAPGSSSGRERRKGREGEMAAACEGLQLLLSLPIVPSGDIREVVMLYLKLAGFFDMQGTEDVITFCGAMLACSATSALVRPGRGGEGSGMVDRSAYSEIAKMLECGADSVANADQTPAPARGYLQMILAVSQILAADDRGYQLSLRHAVLNRALFHIESKIVPCASLERWHEYAAPLIGGIESVLQCVSSDMRDKLDEYAIFVELAYPERRHETITCLLRSLARAHTKLPHLPLRSPFGKQVMMYTHTRRSIFEGHELELIKRWVVKTMSLEEQREYLFALKGSFLELLAALFTSLRARLLSPETASEAQGDARELLRVADLGILEPMQMAPLRVIDGVREQMQVAPSVFVATLNEYADVVSSFLGLPHTEGYLWTAERQQVLGSVLGHSEGHVFPSGPSDQHRQEERERWRAYECQLVDYVVRWTRFLRAALSATRLLEGAMDPLHPLAPASLLRGGRDLIHLWARPLPPPIKAEIVFLLAAIPSGGWGGGGDNEAMAMLWGEFVRGLVMQPVQVLQQAQYQQPHITPCTTPAFMFDFLDLDRTRASYEHTLAFLSLLQAIFEKVIPWDDCCLAVLQSCTTLIPKTHGGQSGVVFNNPSQKWMLSSAVFRLIATALQTMRDTMQGEAADIMSHPGRATFETLLGWVVTGDGGGLGLRSKLVDVVSLGLELAEESEDAAELPHLAESIENAIRLLHIAVSLSAEHYNNTDLLNAIIAERGGSTKGRHSLVLTIFRYIALEDEPKLASAALDLAMIVGRDRDSEVYQVLCSETPPAIRDRIISACASWVVAPPLPPPPLPEDGLASAPTVNVSEGVLSLILESLSGVETEGCVAHFLLGFTPFRISSTDLSGVGASGALLRAVCDGCMEGEWIGDWNVLAGRRVTEMQNREGDDGEEGNGPTLASVLDGFARKQKCLEALYHLTRHPETRDPMHALLCNPYGTSQGGEGEGGLLYELAVGLPESHAGKGMLAHLRESVRCLRDGEGLGDAHMVRLWGGGRYDLTEAEVEGYWVRAISEGTGGVDNDQCLEELMAQRWRCDEEEQLLEDCLEPHLAFLHKGGWFLRTVATVLRSASEKRGVSRDRARALLKVLFGQVDGGGGGRSQVGTASLSLWVPGKFQHLLDIAMDVPEIETGEGEVLHEALEPSDYDECTRPVDRWSNSIHMYNEVLITDRLYKRIAAKGVDRIEAHGLAEHFVARRIGASQPTASPRRPVSTNSYDGYNVLRRCRSARQHLLCGLQDVLEEALQSGLLEEHLREGFGVGGDLPSLLYSLLEGHLLPSSASATTPSAALGVSHYAEHVTRCIGLAVASICGPPSKNAFPFSASGQPGNAVGQLQTGPGMANGMSAGAGGAGGIDGATLLSFLDRILAMPSRSAASRSMSLRTNLYTAILHLIHHLQRGPSAPPSTPPPPPPEELEAVLSRHRASLLQVAVKDLSSPDDKPPAWDPAWEGRTVALAIVQLLLPVGRPSLGPANSSHSRAGGGRGSLPSSSFGGRSSAFASSLAVSQQGPGLEGIISQYNLLMHLCDDLEGRTALGEVLDITLTESRHAHLLAYKGKMGVVLHMAQDPDGLRELTDYRLLDKLASCSFLLTHAQGERHIRSLLRRPKGGFELGILARRFHQLLLPTLQLLVALLHDERDAASLREPAARFIWGHRHICREVLCGQPGGGGGGGEDECAAAAKFLTEAIATADGLGAFTDSDGAIASAGGGGGGDLDRCVCEWMSVTLTRALGGGIAAAGDAPVATVGDVAAGVKGAAREKCVEQALRFFQGRATRAGQIFFDCSPLLSMPSHPRAATEPGGGDLSVTMLVDLLVKSVDSLCGSDYGGSSGGAYSGGGYTMGGGGAGGGGLWKRLRDLVTERDALRAQAASLQGGGDLLRLPLLESECTAASAQLRRALCLSEMTLALIVDSVAIQMGSSPSAQRGALPSPGGAGGDQFQVLGSTVSCSHKLWNRSRNGAVQRLQQFYRERHVERSLPCDWPLLQRLVNQLLAQLRPATG